MSEDLLIGLAATAIPLFALGFLLLRRSPAIFRFFMALLLVGLGYLGVTGALNDIGRIVKGEQEPLIAPAAAPVEPTPAPPSEPPAADSAPEPAPLPPEEAPVGEPAPAPVEPTPEDIAPEPEASPPPPEMTPDGGVTPPEALPPANP